MRTKGTLRGRDPELKALRALILGLARGRGFTVLLEGAPGLGKTRLVDVALEGVKGCSIARSAADAFETDRPLGVVADALEIPGSSLEQRSPEAITDLIDERSTQVPVLIVLEDLHWVDPVTPILLTRLSGVTATGPVGMICSYRPGPLRAELMSALDLLRERGASEIILAPLSLEAANEVAADLLGARIGDGLRRQIESAGGNPLFIKESIAAFATEGLIDTSDGVADVPRPYMPPALRVTLLRRLSFLPTDTLELLRLAAVLGSHFSARELSLTSGRKPISLSRVLAPAAKAGLILDSGENFAFAHDLIREALYEDLPEATRRGMHRDVAARLIKVGGEALRIATHLSLGAGQGDDEAITWLHRAALEARTTAPAVSAELLENAIRLVEPNNRRPELLADLVEALVWSGRVRAAEDTARRELARPQPGLIRTRLVAGLIDSLLHQDRMEEAVQIDIEDPSEGLNEVNAVRLRSRANLAFALAYVDLEASERLADDVLQSAEANPDPVAEVTALIAKSEILLERGDLAAAVAAGERARIRSFEDVSGEASRKSPLLTLAASRIFLDSREDLDGDLSQFLRYHEASANTSLLPVYHMEATMAEYVAGRWDEAVAEGHTAIETGRETGVFVESAYAFADLAAIALHRNRITEAAQLIASSEEAARDHPAIAWARALHLEAIGLPHDSIAILQPLLAHLRGDRYLPVAFMYGPDLVRIALRVGGHEVAKVIVEAVERSAGVRSVATLRGIGLRLRAMVQEDLALMMDSVAALRQGWWRIHLAWALEDTARLLIEEGRTEEAVPLLTEALELYEEAGAITDTARADALLRQAGVLRRPKSRPERPATGWESLTDAERRVLRLVADGLSNGQVAGQLFISKRTVETHVSRLFQKLEVGSRAELISKALVEGGVA